ncbi:hypothetical protein, partial [Vibrio vulnificus]|uniref:hypothetical protein n=1 Tax=Vibrio vulnificus TaxID=672 RepID=UPI0039B4A34C
MLAHAHFGKGIHKAGTQAKHDMLHSIGVNWNDGDDHFKRGVFVKKVEVLKPLSDDVLSKIPEKHRPTEPTI